MKRSSTPFTMMLATPAYYDYTTIHIWLTTMIASSDDPDNAVDDVSDVDEAVAAAGGGVIPSHEGISLCQQLYIESGNEKEVLFLLSIGLMNHNNEPIFLFEQEPWSILPKTFLHPRSNEYVNEIVRHANLFSTMPVP